MNSKLYFRATLAAFAGLLLFPGSLPAFAKAAPVSTNAITLRVSPNPAQLKQRIILAASVTTNGVPATGGTVTFYDGKLALASAQVVGNHPAKGYKTGVAVLTTILHSTSHLLTAVYAGTAASPQVVTSNSVLLQVSGTSASRTALFAQPNGQNPKNYDFTAAVGGLGFAPPSGIVDFSDVTSGTDLASAPLDSATTVHTFASPLVTIADGAPAQAVVADFNGDGFPDVVTANASFGISTVAVFLGKGNGSFQAPTTYVANYFTSGIVAGDFNNDGILDLAVMSQADSNGNGIVQLYLGNGDGTFQNPLNNVVGGLPVAIAVADYNRDGILDYATIDYFANTVSVSLGKGDGTFLAPVPYGVGGGPYYVATADFNGDGFADLAVVNDNDNTVSVLLNKGDGTFGTQTTHGTGNQVEFVVAAALYANGLQDLVVANFADETVGVFNGNGDGTFNKQVTYPVGGNDSGLAIADLNGDGIPDIAVSYYQPAQIGVLLGQSHGTFTRFKNFDTGQTQGYELTLADLDGDGTPDVINCDITSSLSVLLNDTTTRALITNIAIPGTGNQKIVASYPGDGHYSASKSKPLTVQGSENAK